MFLLLYIWWRRRRQRFADARAQHMLTSNMVEVDPSTRLIQHHSSPVTIPAVLTSSTPTDSRPAHTTHDLATPFFSISPPPGNRDAAPLAVASSLPGVIHEAEEHDSRVSAELPNPYDRAYTAFHSFNTSRELPALPVEPNIRPISVASSSAPSTLSNMPLLRRGSTQPASSSSNRISILHEELTVHQKDLEARFAQEMADGTVPDPPPTYRDF